MKEGDRPISRPARVQTPPAREIKQPQARPSPVAIPGAELIHAQPEKVVVELPKVEAELPAPLDFSELIALSEMIAAAPRRELRAQTRPRTTRASNDLRVAAATAPAPAPDFVEPRHQFTISKEAVAPCLTAVTGDDADAGERYRTLAVRLLNQAAKRKLKTVVVTSARAEEGKSTVATNLAWAMSKPGERRVLLIDANPDQPSVCRMLGVNPQRGWADVIEGGAQISDAIARIDPSGLCVLAANAGRGFDRSDVISSPRLEKLIADLERHFDFVIIDAPAIKSVGAQRLASIADGTVMVVRAGRTPHDEVTEALKLVPRDACAGVVLNESDTKEPFTRKDRKTLLARLFSRRA